MQGSMMGVGPALRRAREHRGLTVDEASRDTRIRTEFLEALEDEDFDILLGDVYVRGCLRSYSNYLGLDPDKVVSAYASHLTAPPAPGAAAPPVRLEPAIRSGRRRDNHRLAFMVAAVLLILAAAFGVLSKSRSAPPPATLPTTPPSAAGAVDQQITVALEATRLVQATITADGVTQTVTLHPGEGRSFAATESLTVQLSRGGAVGVTENGRDLGRPGRPGRPWKKTFSFQTEATPSLTG